MSSAGAAPDDLVPAVPDDSAPGRRWSRAEALVVVRALCAVLRPACDRLVVVGSLRRRKLDVGDIEMLYIPRLEKRHDAHALFPDLADPLWVNCADLVLDGLLRTGILTRRLGQTGRAAWGEQNKLALHCASGIGVDFFAARPTNWWNLLVCRTGSAASNVRVCQAAQKKGWRWSPYSPGFLDVWGKVVAVESERDVFEFVGLPYQEPWDRI